MSVVRLLFYALIEQFPVFSFYLSPNANIVHCANFENGLVKIISKEGSLSLEETNAVHGFEVMANEDGDVLSLGVPTGNVGLRTQF